MAIDEGISSWPEDVGGTGNDGYGSSWALSIRSSEVDS